MSAMGRKVLDLAEQQGLLDGKAIAELRKHVAESKFIITPEAIAKVLVDHGHLTPFQARKLVSQALGTEPSFHERPPPKKADEDLTFADDRSSRKPASPKPSAPSAPARPADKAISVPEPVDGSTADDFVELEPIDPAPHARGARWRTDAPQSELAETVELSPLDFSAPQVPQPTTEIVGLDDVLGAEPLAAPRPRGVRGGWQSPLSLPGVPGRRGKNPWDSPLLLVGGAVLGVTLVAFALLLYALTRGSAAELFAKAEEEYQRGSYPSALAIYDQFLKRYPSNPEAGLARVRHGMAELRQVADDGQSPRQALNTAQQVLPQIENEEKFGEARSELATILPEIADGLATQAAQAAEPKSQEQLVKLTTDALALVNNPSYLPASLRKERETRIARIIDKLQVAERGIQQDKDLAGTIAGIDAAAKAGDAAAAYERRTQLLRKYPALAANAELTAAIRLVGEKERDLVTVASPQTAALTSDRPPASERVTLAYRDGPAAASGDARPAFLLIEGAVYGIDVASGRILWRRHVGYESTAQPLGITESAAVDAIVYSAQHRELLRLKGSTGAVLWRQPLAEPAAQPILAGSDVVLTTRSGRVHLIEAGSGKIVRTAQLPQRAAVATASTARSGTARSGGESRIYQLGEHSTLFVLDAASLACTETFHVGHQAGAIFIPPLAILGQVLVVESPTDELSTLRVLALDPKTNRLTAAGRTFRLKGRVVQPLAVSRNRVAAVTDLGHVAVYEVDPSSTQEPVRQIANLDASETAPQPVYCALDGNRLWVAHRRRMMFELQTSLQQLTRRWSENHDDVFLGPLQLHNDTLIDVRTRDGVAAVLVQGCQASDGRQTWATHAAAPVVAIVANDERKAAVALTQEGRLFALNAEAFTGSLLEKPSFSPTGTAHAIFDTAAATSDGQSLVWTETKPSGRAFLYDVVAGKTPVPFAMPAAAASPAQRFASGVLAPLADGSVTLIPPAGSPATTPFLPPLAPGELPAWTQPAIVASGSSIVISDGRSKIFALARQEQPQPHLTAKSQSGTAGPVISPLVIAGTTAIGVMHLDSGDAIVGYDAQAAAAFEPIALLGRVSAGPFAVGGLAFAYAEPDGLVCLESNGKVRWRHSLAAGPIAGPPLATTSGDMLLLYQSGLVARIDAMSGRQLAQRDIGEPLGGAGCLVGDHVLVAGSDGTIHRITAPNKPE